MTKKTQILGLVAISFLLITLSYQNCGPERGQILSLSKRNAQSHGASLLNDKEKEALYQQLNSIKPASLKPAEDKISQLTYEDFMHEMSGNKRFFFKSKKSKGEEDSYFESCFEEKVKNLTLQPDPHSKNTFYIVFDVDITNCDKKGEFGGKLISARSQGLFLVKAVDSQGKPIDFTGVKVSTPGEDFFKDPKGSYELNYKIVSKMDMVMSFTTENQGKPTTTAKTSAVIYKGAPDGGILTVKSHQGEKKYSSFVDIHSQNIKTDAEQNKEVNYFFKIHGIDLIGKDSNLYYSSGKFDLHYNNWTGNLTYQGGENPPLMDFTDGNIDIKGRPWAYSPFESDKGANLVREQNPASIVSSKLMRKFSYWK